MQVEDSATSQGLSEHSADRAIQDLRNGKLQDVDMLASSHVAHIRSTGVRGSPHVAINGQIHSIDGNPMV